MPVWRRLIPVLVWDCCAVKTIWNGLICPSFLQSGKVSTSIVLFLFRFTPHSHAYYSGTSLIQRLVIHNLLSIPRHNSTVTEFPNAKILVIYMEILSSDPELQIRHQLNHHFPGKANSTILMNCILSNLNFRGGEGVAGRGGGCKYSQKVITSNSHERKVLKGLPLMI